MASSTPAAYLRHGTRAHYFINGKRQGCVSEGGGTDAWSIGDQHGENDIGQVNPAGNARQGCILLYWPACFSALNHTKLG